MSSSRYNAWYFILMIIITTFTQIEGLSYAGIFEYNSIGGSFACHSTLYRYSSGSNDNTFHDYMFSAKICADGKN